MKKITEKALTKNPYLAPLYFLQLPLRKKLRYILQFVFLFWMVLSAPLSWVYDLAVGSGPKQGQFPDQSVPIVRTQEELAGLWAAKAPATVRKQGLVQCPLAYTAVPVLLDDGADPYLYMDYPLSWRDRLFPWFSAYCTSYYLAPLEDGTYVCVYFDHYLRLLPRQTLQTGHVRQATVEEAAMLRNMSQDYAVAPEYVLDMYRPGKVWGVPDLLARFALALLIEFFCFRQRRKKEVPAAQSTADAIPQCPADSSIPPPSQCAENQQYSGLKKFILRPQERVIGSAYMYDRFTITNGTFYVTDQRVCFRGNALRYLYMELPLSQVAGYELNRILLTPEIFIYDRRDPDNTRYHYSGLHVKQIQGWLEQMGIHELT